MDSRNKSVPPGTVLVPGDKLRPPLLTSCLLHARQGHNGAPWHEDYRDETDRQYKKRLPFENKSRFDSVTLMTDAIELARDAVAVVADNGNLVMIVNFGFVAGYDAVNKRRTDIAAVVQDPITGEVVSVYPGRPTLPLPRS